MTYSLLRLGEPRLRGKASGGPVDPCERTEAIGENILDSIDTEFSQLGGGPQGDEFPFVAPIPANPSSGDSPVDTFLWPNQPDLLKGDGPFDVALTSAELSQVTYAYEGAGGGGGTGGDSYLSTANPRSGTRHIRGTVGSLADRTSLINVAEFACDPSGQEGIWTGWPVSSGAVITIGVWVSVSSVAGTPDVVITTYDPDLGLIEDVTPIASAGSYAQYTTSFVWNYSWFPGFSVGVNNDPSGATVCDFDDFSLGIAP